MLSSLFPDSPPPLSLSLHRFETNSVVGLYFGRRWEIAYTICIVLFIFSGLWAYATVFANSMMVFVPFPGLSAGLKPASTNSTLATVRRARLCVSGSVSVPVAACVLVVKCCCAPRIWCLLSVSLCFFFGCVGCLESVMLRRCLAPSEVHLTCSCAL